jgi:hypothetical protein
MALLRWTFLLLILALIAGVVILFMLGASLFSSVS